MAYSYRGRRRRGRRGPAVPVLIGTVVIVIVALVISLSQRSTRDGKSGDLAAMSPADYPNTLQYTPQPAPPSATNAVVAVPASPTPTPYTNLVDPYLMVRPVANDGFMPVFRKANNLTDKVVAITVDDCFQFSNTRSIVDLALSLNGKITLFPIAKNALRDELQEILRYAYQNGMEIENHTYSHNGLYGDTDEELAQNIYLADSAMDYILGVDYQMHFLRPRGGDDRNDQRTHAYIQQLGYKGIAHWTMSGSTEPMTKLLSTVEPGNIYLFHTTDNDLKKLQEFLPALTEMGYRLVTLNEMFGYPENETQPLTKSVEELQQVPPLQSYETTLVDLYKGDYMYAVKVLQERLIELGYLDGTADGVYGQGTFMAVGYFQQDNGIQPTGNADVATQQILYSANAARKVGAAQASNVGEDPDEYSANPGEATEEPAESKIPVA